MGGVALAVIDAPKSIVVGSGAGRSNGVTVGVQASVELGAV